MASLHHTIGKAQRRLWLIQTLRLLGWLALTALAIAAALLLIDRLTAATIPDWVYAALGAATLIVGPVWAWFVRPTAHAAAASLDARLGLKDRLATAIYVESQRHPFAGPVIADANRIAEQANLKQAMPVRAGSGWRYATAMGAVVAALAVFLNPQGALFGGQNQTAKQDNQQEEAQQQRIKKVNASAQRMQKQDDSKQATRDPNELMKQLASISQRDLSQRKAQKDAAAEISKIKDQLDDIARDKEKQVQSMQSAMSRLDTGQQGPADRFENALRRGDYQAARKALEAMREKVENGDYSAEQREKLNQQLDSLSKQLNKAAQQASQQSQQAQQSAQQTLKQAGLGQKQINQLKQQGMNQQAVQKALQKQGMSQQQAKQTAKQVQKQQQQAKQGKGTSQQMQGLSSSLGQMASSMKQGQSGQQGQQGQKGQQAQQGQKGQQGPGGSKFKQGAYSAKQQLKQMSRMKQSLQQVNRAQSKAQQQMQRASAGGSKQGQGQQKPAGQRRGGGRGGLKAGTGEGGNPIGQPKQAMNTKRHASEDIHNDRGRVITSWQENGEMATGDANVEFERTVKSAQSQAEQAVNEDRVPRRYHGAIKDYFNQLPDSAKEQQGAPPAPR
jgi:hypothetical protein